MATRTPADVRKQIASGDTDPVYLLQGEDDVEKAALAAQFISLVDDGLAAFNVERVHAGDWTTGDRLAGGVGSLVAAVRTLPMMSPRRVVIVSQAEALHRSAKATRPSARWRSSARSRAARDHDDAGARRSDSTSDQTTSCSSSTRRSSTADRRRTPIRDGSRRVWTPPASDRSAGARWRRWPDSRIGRRATATRATSSGCAEKWIGCCSTRSAREISMDDVREVAGPAALQDDWAMANAIEDGKAPSAPPAG